MIICELYQGQNMDVQAYKIFSDKNVLIIKDGYYYPYLITTDNDITKITESNIGIMPPIASKDLILKVLTNNYQNISEQKLLKGRNILNNILSDVETNNLYYIIFLIPEWDFKTEYHINEKIRYEGNIYKVLKDNLINELPSKNNINYLYIEKPNDLIENWSEKNAPYQKNDKVRIGDYIYVSLINENIWSPENFPSGWQLQGSQV